MKKIRFGIVGTGTIAHRFAEAIKNVPGAELVAVASRTKENAEKFGDEFAIPVRFDSYEKMAQSDVIDAAYIAVPHSGHITCSCLMMNNKKHVITASQALGKADIEDLFSGVFSMELGPRPETQLHRGMKTTWTSLCSPGDL